VVSEVKELPAVLVGCRQVEPASFGPLVAQAVPGLPPADYGKGIPLLNGP
jgi:hypothetical protein